MAGYSGTPLPKKLGIREGSRVLLVGAPDKFEAALGELPPGAEAGAGADAPADVLLFFTTERAALEERFAELARLIAANGGLWVAWPKKSSGVPTDLTENVVREIGLAAGLVDNKVCAIDATWSGLRFVYRVKDRGAATARAS
ncbi:MAG: DUF3052 domain-containing protein [Hyphomicrobiales bacterium]